MGERTIEKSWYRNIKELIDRLNKLFDIEAVIIFGSWVRSGGGDWSDIDVLIIGNVNYLDPLERFRLVTEYKLPRMDVFLYTYEELKRMFEKGNPLAISALVEGFFIKKSKRIEELAKKAKKCFIRRGRIWISKC